MTEAIHGYGTLLKRGNGAATEVFTAIAELLDIDGPDMSADMVDATHQESTDGWDESIPTILRGGTVSFDLHFLPRNNTQKATGGLLGDFRDRTKRNYQLVFPSSPATTWKFAAYVQNFKPGAPVNERLTASVTLKLTGKPTLA